MAKKITDKTPLERFEDPWGGVYEEGPNAGKEWGKTREEVERVIKGKMKSVETSRVGRQETVQDLNGNNVIAGFADDDAYLEWLALGDEEKWGDVGQQYMITRAILPSIEGSDVYSVTLAIEKTPDQTQENRNVTVNIKAVSTITYAAGGTEPINELLTVIIQTRTSTTASWTDKLKLQMNSNADYIPVSLAPYLVSGTNYIRMRAEGEYASSIWKSFQIDVVNLSLTPNMALEIPMSGSQLQLNYLIGGAIDKRLQLEFGKGRGSDFVAEYSYTRGDVECDINLGTETNLTTGRTFTFTQPSLMSAGRHTVRARLYATENVKTAFVETEYMVAGAGAKPMVIVNDVADTLANWSDVVFFKWAAYTGGSGDMQVFFRLRDSSTDAEIASWAFKAEPETYYTFATQLGLELDANVTELYGRMTIEDENGNALSDPVFITITNTAAYAPVEGADFVLQPANRSNSEGNPQTVVNAVTGEVVPSKWEYFDMTTDGYMEVNADADDVSASAETVRALHIPAGRRLTIGYNPLKDFVNASQSATGLNGKSMTFEIDFRTANVLDEEEPVITIGSAGSDGSIWGFEARALEACLMTALKRVRDDQNVSWAEGVRTRLSVNIVYGLNPENNPTGTRLNYVRIFINDKIEREFNYTAGDRFVAGAGDNGLNGFDGMPIVLGASSADLDVFSIRCYQKALSATEVMQDYKAGLSSAEEKMAFQMANDILGDDGAISFEKAKNAGYNVLGHTGHLPTYGDQNKGKTEGVSLYIGIAGEEERSGTLTNLTGTGQGTTAMTYYDWNQQYKTNDNTEWMGDDGNSDRYGSNGYAIAEGEALAKKLVGKINFASSMQSHKLGLTWAFTDLFKYLVGQGRMSKPGQMTLQENARISVLERPFLFFHRETENDPWTFRYLMTFGAGKGDKPTFGFDKKTTPNLLMVEGADNDRPLALFAAPWNNDVTYSEGDEAWIYAGQKNLNFGLGLTAENSNGEYPSSEAALEKMKAFWNFVYLHHTGIRYFGGTVAQLRAGERLAQGDDGNETPARGRLYWVTTSDGSAERYDLFRWDGTTNDWVNAGVNKERLNIRTQYETFCAELQTTPAAWTPGQWADAGEKARNVRRMHFKEKAEDYMHVDDALYHSCFIKFFAGTDNRAKNTYYYTDPVTMKVRWMQDDLDTVLKTNNVGQNRKPYYVEEHDKNEVGEYYWQGEESGLYNLLEEAFEDDMTAMMQRMMSAMASLGGGSVMGFMEKYLLSTQDYFPGVAYNEMARLVYERASVAQDDGKYQNNAAQAITQSNGSQRWSEYQWLKDRIMYISSWCEYGEFASGTDASGSLSFRGTNGHYAFKLTPAKWMYPRVAFGSSNLGATSTEKRVRVKAGEEFAYQEFDVSNDTTISIRGIDYFLRIGDFNVPMSGDSQTGFAFSGRRLQEVTVNPTGEDTNRFATQSISISNATNIKRFIMRGVDTLSGGVDLSKCVRLEEIDLRGSSANGVTLPRGGALSTVRFPATLTSISIENMPHLTDVTYEGVKSISSVVVKGCPQMNTYDLISMCYYSDAVLTNVRLDSVDWRSIQVEVLKYLVGVANSEVEGSINVATSDSVTFDLKKAMIGKWGDVDSTDNALHVTYFYRQTTEVAVIGRMTLREAGQYKMDARPTNNNANDFKGVRWEISSNSFATIDPETGVVTMRENASNAQAKATVTAIYEAYNQGYATTREIRAQKTLTLYDREAQLGDYVFCDGDFSDEWDGITPVVGICFYINPEDKTDRRMVALNNIGSQMWGLHINSVPNIVLDNQSYGGGAYDTPLPNITSNGTVTITDASYRDEVNGDRDGFKIFGQTTALGGLGLTELQSDIFDFKRGDKIPDGQYQTAVIIKHRNTVLDDTAVNLPIPTGDKGITETAELTSLIDDVVTKNGTNYRQFYYPSASYCYAYEPTVNEEVFTLAEKFKRHNWWLPSCAELARLYWYHSKGYEGGDNAIFSKAAMASVFAAFSSSNYWTSSENSDTSAWSINFQGGTVNGHPNVNSIKYNTNVVRAVAAF